MTYKTLLAAGGTGGHIIPSIAFGLWLQKQGESVIWLSGSRPLEDEIYKAHGVTPQKLSLEGSPLGVSALRSLKRWKHLFNSFFEAHAILKKEQIDRCVLFGGYLSIPVLLAASCLHIPVLMHEQNTVAGRVTRFAARHGIPIACAWEECRGLDTATKKTVTGMPLREIHLINKKDAQKRLLRTFLSDNEKLIVILGGSLGSGGMKKVLQDAQNMIKSTGYKVLCMGIRAEDRPFPEALTHEACWDMTMVFSAADVIICRAGASTLAELRALGIPALVVPWLKAVGQHQLSNARYFSKLTGSPVFLEGSSQKQFWTALRSLAKRRGICEDLSTGAVNLYKTLRSFTV